MRDRSFTRRAAPSLQQADHVSGIRQVRPTGSRRRESPPDPLGQLHTELSLKRGDRR